jgi:hypothetical protein
VNPDRAHTGSGLTGGCPAHPFEAAAPTPAVLACAVLARTEEWPLLVHAVTSKAAATSGTKNAPRLIP